MKEKKKRSIDKYSMGSGRTGTVKNYMPNPAEVLTEDKINSAEAIYDATTNPLVIGLKTAGNMAMQYGISKGGFGEGAGGQMANALLPTLGNMEFAMGGKTGNSQVEIEGEEVTETPDGEVIEHKGPSHEEGGIDVVTPDGTKVFSKRLEVENKSMAKRKLAREKKMSKLMNKLKDSPMDKLLQSTIDRTQEANDIEEQTDMMIQEFAKGLENIIKQTGEQFALGGLTGEDEDPPIDPITGLPLIDVEAMKKGGSDAFHTGDNGVDYMSGTTAAKSAKAFEEIQTTQPKSGTKTKGKEKEDSSDEKSNMKITAGDATGFLGTAISALGPLSQTLKARAEDTPNINAFEDFGNDALEANENAKNYVAGQRDNALTDLNLSRNAMVRRGRNSARGVNQMRAMDLAADQNANKAMREIYDSFARQMMSLYSQQAGLENQQDAAVMKGEQQRDLADRQDKDNHRTNMAQNLANVGTAVQKAGKDINQIISNEDFMDLLPALNSKGISLEKDSKGWYFTDANGNKEYVRQ